MHFIRRAALRAASSAPSSAFVKPTRSITTSSPFALRSKVQSGLTQSSFRRFASDEAGEKKEENESSQGGIREAVENVAETVQGYASEGAERFGRAKEAVADAAYGATGYQSSRERRPFNGGEARPLEPTKGIYIGNLLFDVTQADLEREFSQYGKVISATIASDARGLSKGFGYVEFEEISNATAAIEGKHQTVLEGRRIVVNYQAKTQRSSTPNPPSKTLFIGNLAFEMSDADLNKLFRDIRNVIDVRVAIDRRTGQPRGFAHADFVDVDSAVKGFEALSDKEVYGRRLRVDYSAGVKNNDRGVDGPRREPRTPNTRW